jgi:hypothetical protein
LTDSFGFAASGDTAILIGFSTTAAGAGRVLVAGLAGAFELFTVFFFPGVFVVAIALSSLWVNAGRQKSSASIARVLRV